MKYLPLSLRLVQKYKSYTRSFSTQSIEKMPVLCQHRGTRIWIIPNTLNVDKSTTITTTVSQSSQGFAPLVYGVCKAVTYTGHNQTYTTFRAWLWCGLVQYIETEAKRSPFSRRPFNACSWIEMHECSIIFQWSLLLEVQLTISQNWFRLRFDAD